MLAVKPETRSVTGVSKPRQVVVRGSGLRVGAGSRHASGCHGGTCRYCTGMGVALAVQSAPEHAKLCSVAGYSGQHVVISFNRARTLLGFFIFLKWGLLVLEGCGVRA